MSLDSMIDYLDDLFGGLKVDEIRDEATASTRFVIEVDAGIDMTLSIADACVAANAAEAIEAAVASNAKAMLEANQNATVTMAADLSCSVV